MNKVDLTQLIEAGAHFGHLTRRWNPKMKSYIFMEKNGIHIIDLKKTQKHLTESAEELSKLVADGRKVLFVGTKKQAKSVEKQETDGTFEKITKKERLFLTREKDKLKKVLEGVETMGKLPGALFIVDIKKESIAVQEAHRLNIPVFAIVDTNCDPDEVDYLIPANDDAVKTVEIITKYMADSVIEGDSKLKEKKAEEVAEKERVKKEKETERKEEAKKKSESKLKKEAKEESDSKEKSE